MPENWSDNPDYINHVLLRNLSDSHQPSVLGQINSMFLIGFMKKPKDAGLQSKVSWISYKLTDIPHNTWLLSFNDVNAINIKIC
jgi:hypothetical protein